MTMADKDAEIVFANEAEAESWDRYAAAALQGGIIRNGDKMTVDNIIEFAVDAADEMLIQSRARRSED